MGCNLWPMLCRNISTLQGNHVVESSVPTVVRCLLYPKAEIKEKIATGSTLRTLHVSGSQYSHGTLTIILVSNNPHGGIQTSISEFMIGCINPQLSKRFKVSFNASAIN
jgi:hypothetical protein